jgi:hypothetical protein
MLDVTIDLVRLTESLIPYFTVENEKRVRDHLMLLKKLLLKSSEIRRVSKALLEDSKALFCSDYWLRLEVAAQELSNTDDVLFRRCLLHIAKCVQPDVISPSVVTVFDTDIRLLTWYRSKFSLGKELHSAIICWDKRARVAGSTRRSNAQNALKCLKLLCNSHDDVYKGVSEFGLQWFVSVNQFREKLSLYPITDRRRVLESALLGVLQEYRPTQFNSVTIAINHKNVDITDLAQSNPDIVNQLIKLSKLPKFTGNREHDLRSITQRFIANVTSIRKVFTKYPEQVDGTGLDSFKLNRYELLNLSKEYLSKIRFSELLLFLQEYFRHEINRHDYMPNLLPFYFKKKAKYRLIDYSDIAIICPGIIDNVNSLHNSEIELLSQKNYGMQTLHARFGKLRRLLLNYVLPYYLNEIVVYGFMCLSMNNNRIQKAIFQQIQSDVKDKSIARTTGASYAEVVRWLMGVTGQPVIEAFKLSYKRHQRHAQRLRMEDLYTDDELKELVFYVERGIREAESQQQLLALYFARIQMKSCWNTSPMADIELSDLTDVALPTSKKSITLLIQKPRKGYDIDTYSLDGRTVNSVMRDILYVRDELTEKYRCMAQSETENYLFIYKEKTRVYRLDADNIVIHIKTILSRLGCRVAYNSMRIRKNGSNHIYREVSKQIRAYESVKLHTYDTFIQHYQRVSESKTQQTLHTAVDVMQRYFTGREIAPEIKVLMVDDGNTQKTPTGECASKGNDAEAAQYKKEHRKLESNHKDMWCSDFLACVWCKHFRTVADPDHVWQLLSYRDYVLADMTASTSDIDNNDFQQEAIDALYTRVDAILKQVKIKSPMAITKGNELMQKKGMHPFWSFAVTSIKNTAGDFL